MKLIISHSHTKRQIDGPFSICGSREDIELLATQLLRHVEQSEWTYGWTTIYDKIPTPLVNTPPVAWDA